MGYGPQGMEYLTTVLQGASHWNTGETPEATCWGASDTHWRSCTTRSPAGSCTVATGPEEQEEKHKNRREKPLPLAVALQRPLLTNLKLVAGKGEMITGSSSGIKT